MKTFFKLLVPTSVVACIMLLGCRSTSILIGCKVSRDKLLSYQDLALVTEPEVGQLYFFEGTYYSEFEDSGIVLGVGVRPDLLEDLKISAYCVTFEEACLESVMSARKGMASNRRLLELRGLARLETLHGSAHELATNQCAAGTLHVTGLSQVRPAARLSSR
jgi:hypothetical protein